MNHRVPDFREMEEEDCVIPSSSGFPRPKKPSAEEEEIMELLWQNGQVVVQKSANNKAPFAGGGSSDAAVVREIRGSGAAAEEGHHLFMHEDEMASWLHYPIEDSSFARDLCADDLFYSAPMTTAEIRPPPAPPRPPISQPPPQRQGIPPRIQNFRHFSRLPRMEASSVAAARESTAAEPNVVHTASGTPAAVNTGLAALPCELTLTSSSPGASGGASFSASAERSPPRQKAEPSAAVGDRKRKAREADYNECQSEDMDFDAAEAKKQACGSTSTRRSRAALVHNQSERRRRDRINEKMKALQELIPHCNKSDKASMLDEAIEYMKSLQMQLQHMMSMGCGMVPMMYPAMQQHYMPAMMMGMGVNRPMMPYPSILPGSTIQNPAMGPRFPMALPGCHLPQVPLSDHSGNQASPLLNSHDSNQPRMQNLADPYQQFFSFHHAQLPSSQNQAGVQPPTTEPNTSKEVRDPKSKESGRR